MVLTESQLESYRVAYNRLPDDVEAAHDALEHAPGHIDTIRDPHLARDIGRYLAERRASSMLGLGIYVRSGTMGKATCVFLEETLHKDRASVVHVLPQLPRQVGRAIPTLWTFGENAFGCCNGQCVAYCNHDLGGLGYCGHRKTGSHMVCV